MRFNVLPILAFVLALHVAGLLAAPLPSGIEELGQLGSSARFTQSPSFNKASGKLKGKVTSGLKTLKKKLSFNKAQGAHESTSGVYHDGDDEEAGRSFSSPPRTGSTDAMVHESPSSDDDEGTVESVVHGSGYGMPDLGSLNIGSSERDEGVLHTSRLPGDREVNPRKKSKDRTRSGLDSPTSRPSLTNRASSFRRSQLGPNEEGWHDNRSQRPRMSDYSPQVPYHRQTYESFRPQDHLGPAYPYPAMPNEAWGHHGVHDQYAHAQYSGLPAPWATPSPSSAYGHYGYTQPLPSFDSTAGATNQNLEGIRLSTQRSMTNSPDYSDGDESSRFGSSPPHPRISDYDFPEPDRTRYGLSYPTPDSVKIDETPRRSSDSDTSLDFNSILDSQGYYDSNKLVQFHSARKGY